jgi:hypothetical protein
MTPYTYHLYHVPTGQHYYGARYKKDCSPNDLWTTYFSSSPVVHSLIEQYGKDSFIPKVRRTFNTSEEAVLWESKFLQKIDAQHNNKWLNRHNGSSDFRGPHRHSEASKSKIKSKITGIKRSEETKAKMRVKAIDREAKRRAEGWTMPDEAKERAMRTRQERIALGIINPYSEERNKKLAEAKRGKKRKYLPDGSFIMVDPQELQYDSLAGEQLCGRSLRS